MMQRNLTITLESDWKAAMRATAKLAKAKTYPPGSITTVACAFITS
jgi:hypothetical protein